MKTDAVIQSIRGRTGLDEQAARDATEATLQTLGELLPAKDRKHFGKKLPEALERYLNDSKGEQEFDLDTFYARVAQREGVAMGFGMEHAQAVCQALSRHLSKDDRVFVQRRLPDDFEVLFAPPEIDRVPPYQEEGPGGDVEPQAKGAEEGEVSPGLPAQSGSVAASPNPHGDRKLSTGHSGPNEGRDLATGRAGPSEGRDLATGVPPDHVPQTGEDQD